MFLILCFRSMSCLICSTVNFTMLPGASEAVLPYSCSMAVSPTAGRNLERKAARRRHLHALRGNGVMMARWERLRTSCPACKPTAEQPNALCPVAFLHHGVHDWKKSIGALCRRCKRAGVFLSASCCLGSRCQCFSHLL